MVKMLTGKSRKFSPKVTVTSETVKIRWKSLVYKRTAELRKKILEPNISLFIQMKINRRSVYVLKYLQTFLPSLWM